MSNLSLQFPTLVTDFAKDHPLLMRKDTVLEPSLIVNEDNIASQSKGVQIAAGYVPKESYYLGEKPASMTNEVNGAKSKYEAWESQRPESYREKYEKEIKSLLGELGGMSFDYDPENDPVFRLSRDEAVRRGRLAMEDAMGKAAADMPTAMAHRQVSRHLRERSARSTQ